jgi:S1-C subfamily serine protease
VAKPVMRELLAGRRVVRPSLALVAVSVTSALAYVNGLPMDRGALVTRVEEGGNAAAAGIRDGDVITAIGGRPVKDLHHLHESLERHRIGDPVAVTVWRAGQSITVHPALEEYR